MMQGAWTGTFVETVLMLVLVLLPLMPPRLLLLLAPTSSMITSTGPMVLERILVLVLALALALVLALPLVLPLVLPLALFSFFVGLSIPFREPFFPTFSRLRSVFFHPSTSDIYLEGLHSRP
jgi:hypothetical protein